MRYNARMAKRMEYHRETPLSREEVRACDAAALKRYGISGIVLMENAGGAAAREALAMLTEPRHSKVCILAGTGNNGGDGFVVARHLYNAGVTVDVLVCGARDRIGGDGKVILEIIEKMGLSIHWLEEKTAKERIAEICGGADLLAAGLRGTGTAGEPRGVVREAIEAVNAAGKPILSLDIPSGLDCDTGEPLGAAVRAERPVPFAANKKGFLNPSSKPYTGTVIVASIGIDVSLLV